VQKTYLPDKTENVRPRGKPCGIRSAEDLCRAYYAQVYSKVVVALTSRPVPRRESFADQAEYIKEVDAWVPISSLVKHVGGGQELLESWVEHQVGDPPSMPKLKKRK
jgi:hypothetical protein